MKRLKITESQATLLKKLGANKKTLKLTSEQFNRLCEATVGAEGVVKNFKNNASKFGVPPYKFKEGVENEIDPNELKKEVISLLKNALSGAEVKEIPPVLQSMGISPDDINNLADDNFMSLPLDEKKNSIDEFVNELLSKQTVIKEEGSEPIKHYHLLGNLDLPDTREEINWGSGPTYTIDSITDGDAKTIVRDKEFFIGRTFKTRADKTVREMGYIKNFAKKFGELPLFQIDGNHIKVVNPNFLKWQDEYRKSKAGVLDKWDTTESTGAASSGAYVGPMTTGKPKNNKHSPSNEMDKIISDNYEDYLSKPEQYKLIQKYTRDIIEYLGSYYNPPKNYDKVYKLIFNIVKKGITGSFNSFDEYLKRYTEYNDHEHLKVALLPRLEYEFGLSDEISKEEFDEYFYYNLIGIMDGIVDGEINTMDESTGASANATYDAPGFAPTKKGTKVGPYKQNIDIYQTNKLTKNEGVDNTTNLDATSWPDGEFVDFDDCVKLNNNKVAQNGGCSQGDSGVVKLKKTKKSIISNQKG